MTASHLDLEQPMTSSPGTRGTDTPAAKRRPHLIDPNAPRRKYDPEAEAKLVRVQQWVMSTLAVTTILHLVVGLIVAAVMLDEPTPGARVGLNIIAGLFGVIAVAAFRAIHKKSLLSPWLLVGVLPTLLGLWLALG